MPEPEILPHPLAAGPFLGVKALRLTCQGQKRWQANPPRRQRLAKVLENYGQRVQKSVFECQVDEGRFLRLKKEVDKLLDPGQDSVRYYFLCRRCRTAIEVRGWGTVREEEDVVIV